MKCDGLKAGGGVKGRSRIVVVVVVVAASLRRWDREPEHERMERLDGLNIWSHALTQSNSNFLREFIDDWPTHPAF